MRVGLFTYGVTSGFTGIGRYTTELSRALTRVAPDLEIVLFTPYRDRTLPWYDEFETVEVPSLRLMPFAATLGNVVLHREARRARVDVLHDPCGIAPFLARRDGFARVTTVHDAIPITNPETQPLLTRLIYQTLVRGARFTADAVLTVSHAAADDLVRYLGLPADKVHVTPNGVRLPTQRGDAAERVAALGVDGPYLLTVGALHPRKNVHRVIEAFMRLRERRHDLRLVIVGAPSWGANHVYARALELARESDAVVFTGHVDEDDLHALYDEALALVFVSLYEGFGLPALEAMAHGTPVIASTTSSLPEVVGDAGLLVDPSDAAAIETAMDRIAGDAPLRRRLAAAGRARAEGFSWDATAAATLDVYRKVVAT